MGGGFIKLHRSMLEWGWYSDVNTKAVFLHLLLTANYEASEYRGRTIERGQAVFGKEKLAETLGLSYEQVRGALDRLKRTGEITYRGTNRDTIVTIVNYGKYQDSISVGHNLEPNQEPIPITTDAQANHNQSTTESQHLRKKEKIDSPNGESTVQPPKGFRVIIDRYTENPALRAVLLDFKQHRDKIKKPMTDRAWKLLLARLDKLAKQEDMKIAILEQSILKGWQDVFELKTGSGYQPPLKEVDYNDF